MNAIAMNAPAEREAAGSLHRAAVVQPVLLGLITLVSRIVCRGPVYFADGPAHLRAIATRVWVIQPPGYWLFNRIAGLFPTPSVAITWMNIGFSVAGILVFYFTAMRFSSQRNAFVAALAYASISYTWFAGEVHSTYASQILFPCLLYYTLLRSDESNARGRMVLAACIFTAGAGLRPFDGLFVAPMFAFFCWKRLTTKQALSTLAITVALCLGWLIPTGLAYRHAYGGMNGVVSYVLLIMRVRSVTGGVNAGSMANVVRYVLPLLVAFFALLPAAFLYARRNLRDWRVQMLMLWIVPGSLFFIFSYISDAPYLTFLTAAILLLGLKTPRMMALTAILNAAIFLLFAPIPSHRLLVNTWNIDIGKYTLYGIRHQWQPNLSQIQPST